MRLSVVETGHTPEMKRALAEQAAKVGHVDGIDLTLAYRPELFGRAFLEANDLALVGESEWTPGDRELFAAFVSGLNQCPF